MVELAAEEREGEHGDRREPDGERRGGHEREEDEDAVRRRLGEDASEKAGALGIERLGGRELAQTLLEGRGHLAGRAADVAGGLGGAAGDLRCTAGGARDDVDGDGGLGGLVGRRVRTTGGAWFLGGAGGARGAGRGLARMGRSIDGGAQDVEHGVEVVAVQLALGDGDRSAVGRDELEDVVLEVALFEGADPGGVEVDEAELEVGAAGRSAEDADRAVRKEEIGGAAVPGGAHELAAFPGEQAADGAEHQGPAPVPRYEQRNDEEDEGGGGDGEHAGRHEGHERSVAGDDGQT